MNTEKKIVDCLLELIKNDDLSGITVSKLCKKLNIKRQTFYYHFENVYDVLEAYYLGETSKLNGNKYLDLDFSILDTYINDNKQVISHVYKIGAESTFENFLYRFFYDITLVSLERKFLNNKENNRVICKSISNLYTKEISSRVEVLLLKDKNVTVKDYLKIFNGVDEVINQNMKKPQFEGF